MQTVNATSIAPLLDYCTARKHFYQFLQLLFFKPLTEETVAQLRENSDTLQLTDMNEGGQLLHHFFDQATESTLLLAKDEFKRLFAGPGSIPAPPWESVYRSQEHLLFGATTYQVRKKYHHFGLQYIRENNEPDDHLILELEFMAYLNDLCMKQQDVQGVADLLSSQIQFLDEHLCQWIPLFTEKILKAAKSDLYRGAALLLNDFILFDVETLKEIKEELANV